MIAHDDPRHGTRNGHRAGCRQDCCVEANRAYHADYYRTQYRPFLGYDGRVDAGPVLAHLDDLMHHATIGEIADALGVRDQTIRYLLVEPPATVRQATHDRIMGLQPGDIVTRLGLGRRIRALTALGWSLKRLARESGLHPHTLRELRNGEPMPVWDRVRQQVLDAYDALHMATPTATTKSQQAAITRARNLAARNGWAPPLAWDNIDDPYETPDVVPTRRQPLDLAEFLYLLRGGEHPERAAKRMGVTISAVEQAARRAECAEAIEAVRGARSQQRKAVA